MNWMSRLTEVAGQALDAIGGSEGAKELAGRLVLDPGYRYPVSQEALNALIVRNLPAGIKTAALTVQDGSLQVDALLTRAGVLANARLELAIEKCRLDGEEQSLVLVLLTDPQIAARGLVGKLLLPLVKTYVSIVHHKSLLHWGLDRVGGVKTDGSRIAVDLAHFGGREILAKAVNGVADIRDKAPGTLGFAISNLAPMAAEIISKKISIVSAQCKAGVVELECQYAG